MAIGNVAAGKRMLEKNPPLAHIALEKQSRRVRAVSGQRRIKVFP